MLFTCTNMIEVENAHFHFPSETGNLSEQLSVASILSSLPMIPRYSEWKYTMRRNMQEIIPGLFLGPYSAAMTSHLKTLLENGVTHIICVRQDIEAYFIRPRFHERFKYLTLDIEDSVNENIIPHFAKVRLFIEECLAVGGKVLIHGNSGVSRSATLVMAYIMQKFGLSFSEAYSLVKERRFCIKPNDGFVAQLIEFEPIYRAQQTLQHGQTSNNHNFTKKRKVEQLDYDSDMLPLPPPPSPVSYDIDIIDMCIT